MYVHQLPNYPLICWKFQVLADNSVYTIQVLVDFLMRFIKPSKFSFCDSFAKTATLQWHSLLNTHQDFSNCQSSFWTPSPHAIRRMAKVELITFGFNDIPKLLKTGNFKISITWKPKTELRKTLLVSFS